MSQPNPYDAPDAPPSLAPETAQLEQQMRGRISWLYWIAALSAINSCIALAGGGVHFIFGLGVTELIDALVALLAQKADPQAARMVGLVGLGLSFACAGLFAMLGYWAIRRSLAAAIIGLVLYAADGLLMLAAGDMLAVGFHAFVLWMLVGGTQSIAALRRMDRAAQAAQFGGPPWQYPAAPQATWPGQPGQPGPVQGWPQQQQSWPQQQQAWPQQPPPSSMPPRQDQ